MSSNRRSWFLGLAPVGAVALVVGALFWYWIIERVEVPPGKFLVLFHHWGNELAPDEILAPDASFKGIMLEVKPEGRHFINPIIWGYQEHKMTEVPPGKCLVLTRKYGKRLPAGEILAEGSHEPQPGEEVYRGILKEPLTQGSYRINPYAYTAELVEAVEVKAGQVGVKTLKVGKDPKELAPNPDWGHYVVPGGYRGVQQHPVSNGTHYLNPYVASVRPVDVQAHRVELSDIEFPSRDGFILKPHVLLTYQVKPDKAPELMVRLTDEGQLHQEDRTPEQIKQNEILQKVILPHMRGYARIEGSNFDARDFLTAGTAKQDPKALNSREKLQRTLFEKVKEPCDKLGIEIKAVTLAALTPPPELSALISEREQARVEQDKNKTRLGTIKAEQELRAAEARKSQEREKVEASTRMVQAKARANQQKQVEELRLKQELANAQLKLDAARKQAEATLLAGKAEAEVTLLKNDAEVAGLRRAIQGFSSAGLFAQYNVMMRLAPALNEVFASDDSDFAKLFAGYLQPQATGPAGKPFTPMPPAGAGDGNGR